MLDLDKRVDVYKENERFLKLHDEYNKTRDDKLIGPMTEIIFHCCANILKSKFGHWWSSEQIEDNALDMAILIVTRIKNFDKWPNGYVIKNLPSVCKFAVFNIVQSKREMEEVSYDECIHGYDIVNAYDTAYYNNCSWEDEILNRIEGR